MRCTSSSTPGCHGYDALKVLGSAVSSDEEYRQRFILEADMVATLSNPHIVTIYDRGEFDDKLWIAMEYVDGTDASRLLAERYPYGMPPDEVVRIITGIAEALDYAHGHGSAAPRRQARQHPAGRSRLR